MPTRRVALIDLTNDYRMKPNLGHLVVSRHFQQAERSEPKISQNGAQIAIQLLADNFSILIECAQ